MTTKIHAVCASEADAVDIRITAGQVGDAPVGEALVEPLDPREGIRHAAMDKAYDSNAIRARGEVDPVFVQDLTEVPRVLGNLLADGDLVLLMGAGDIGALAQRLPETLR